MLALLYITGTIRRKMCKLVLSRRIVFYVGDTPTVRLSELVVLHTQLQLFFWGNS
jgi:hypothetical protein